MTVVLKALNIKKKILILGIWWLEYLTIMQLVK